MLTIGNGHGVLETFLVDEVGQDKCRATAFHHIRQIFQSQTDVRPPAFRMKIYQFADDVKYMLTSLLGRNKLLNPVRKEDDTNLVIILNGRECQCSGNFRHHILLHLLYRTELQTTGNIYQQHHCQFALLLKHLDVRLVEAGGHIPVNVAYVIAKLILAHLGECHTSTLEGRVILPGKDIVGQSARLYLNLTDFLQKFCCFH